MMSGRSGPLVVFGVVPAPPTSTEQDLVAADEIAAVVGPAEVERLRPGRAELLEYHAVLDAWAARGPVVPVRFGTVLPDRAAVAELLAERYDELAAALRFLAGRRQFNLRASYVEDRVLRDLVVSRPEIAVLRERIGDRSEEESYADRIRLGELVARGLELRAAADAETLLDEVAHLVTRMRVRGESSGLQVLDVAMLVEDGQEPRLLARLEELAEERHDELRLRLVGPMAAYDFAGDPAWA